MVSPTAGPRSKWPACGAGIRRDDAPKRNVRKPTQPPQTALHQRQKRAPSRTRTDTARILSLSYLAFVHSSCVGCSRKRQVSTLAALANNDRCRNYCGRFADEKDRLPDSNWREKGAGLFEARSPLGRGYPPTLQATPNDAPGRAKCLAEGGARRRLQHAIGRRASPSERTENLFAIGQRRQQNESVRVIE